MSLEARYQLFGERSDLFVQEAVWSFREHDGGWPSEQELIAYLTAAFSQEVRSEDDARRRLDMALRDGEADLALDEDQWLVRIDPGVYDAITRRSMDRRMPRRDKEETF